MTAEKRLQAIDAIMDEVRLRVKAYVKEGQSTDMRERISLEEIKLIAKLAKEPNAK